MFLSIPFSVWFILLVYTEHLVARIFLMRTVCQVVLSSTRSSLTFRALAWLKMKLCACSKTVHTSRNMSYITPELTSTFSPSTRTPSYPSARPTSTSSTLHSSEINPCHDPQQASIGHTVWSAWDRPGSQTPRRSCGSALDPRFRIG